MRRLLGALALVSMTALAAVPAAGLDGTFSDDDGSVHEADIEAIAAAGITKGCNPPTNDRFCPNDPVTRGQMAAFLTRGLDVPPDTIDRFTDDDLSVFEPDIQAIAAAGITKGCDPPANTRFCPTRAVTRGEMAAFLVRAFGYQATPSSFMDTNGSEFADEIGALAAAGITKGCDPPANTLFCPTRSVSRGEMATFLARALDLEPIQPEPTDPDWYTTPEPSGLERTITVPVAGSPTLSEALAAAQPGDIIELAEGTHVSAGNLVLRNSGTATAWIAIRGAPGATVVDLEGAGEFRISGSYVLMEDLEITDGGGNNLHVAPEGESISNVVLRRLSIHGLRSGPGAAIKINRNNPQNAGVSLVYIEDSDLSEAISNAVVDGVGVSYAVVRDSWIHDNSPGSHGVFYKGGADHVLIEGNLISGVEGNAALQLGGNTGAGFFNPDLPDREGADQVARNNLIADFTDSAIEIRGVAGGGIYHNTIVTQSGFAIFRLSCGNTDTGGVSTNSGIAIANNVVLGTGGDPQYARNDCGDTEISFGAQGWFGAFHNSGSPTPQIPSFPGAEDTASPSLAGILRDSDWSGLTGRVDALDRFRPGDASPILGAGGALSSEVPADLDGATRSVSAPTLGAFEHPD